MAERWTSLALDRPLYANADPAAITSFVTGRENAFRTDQGHTSRFPGLKDFATLGDNGRVFLSDYKDDLLVSTSLGRVYTIDTNGAVTDRTGVYVSGGRRTIFAQTDREVMMAAGGPIVRLRDDKTELLSTQAPLASHVGWVDRFLIAAELNSGRFSHTPAGLYEEWNPLDSFDADGDPDNINGLLVSPFREVLIAGRNSIEQFERTQSGEAAFFRRWSVGEGSALPYGMLWADNALWTVNRLFEVARSSGQVGQVVSAAIGRLLEKIDDWDEAWIGGYPDRPLHTVGHKFILIQAPNATNAYGTKGVTLVYDYRINDWAELYGWDAENGVPARWPGWSHWTLWGRVFVGGEGKVYELDRDTFTNAGQVQRFLVRTAHLADSNPVMVKGFRLHVKRGVGAQGGSATIAVRCARDQRPFGNWIRRSLGGPGQTVPNLTFGGFGIAQSFQFEIACTDAVQVEILKAEVLAEECGN